MKKGMSIMAVGLICCMGFAASVAASDIGTTLAKACGRCHDTSKVCRMVGLKDESAWKTTVARMVDRGAALSSERVGEAAAYLGGLERGTGSVCE